MYVGHFAAALAVKARVPKAPSWALFVGVCFLDFLFCGFILLGWETWRRKMVSIEWSHSVAMAAVWSTVFAACFRSRGPAVFWAVWVAVFSHFALDALTHAAHLVFFPSSTLRFGLALGQDVRSPGWWLELAIVLAACAYYFRAARQNPDFGRYSIWTCGFLVGLQILWGYYSL